jgi:hypothetical protein
MLKAVKIHLQQNSFKTLGVVGGKKGQFLEFGMPLHFGFYINFIEIF